MASIQDSTNPFWDLIIKKIYEVHENSAGYIVTINEFFADVPGKPKMRDLIKCASNLQNELELRPPGKMIRSAKTAIRAANLYANSVPSIHADDTVEITVDLDDMMGNYRGLMSPNLNLTEKSYYITQFAASVCNVFLVTDKFTLGIGPADSDTGHPHPPEIARARDVAEKNLKMFDAVHIGIRDKLREAFRQKLQS